MTRKSATCLLFAGLLASILTALLWQADDDERKGLKEDSASVTGRQPRVATEHRDGSRHAEPSARTAVAAISGRLIDPSGNPPPSSGWSYRYGGMSGSLELDADGNFRIELSQSGSAELHLSREGWTALRDPEISTSRTACTVLVAPLISIAVSVEDPTGLPIEGVEAWIEPPAGAPDEVVDRLNEVRARTNGEGRIAFQGTIWVQGAELHARKAGHAPGSVGIPRFGGNLTIELRPELGQLTGLVQLEDGTPATAEVRLSHAASMSDAGGRFSLSLDPELYLGHRVFAIKQGHRAGIAQITQEVVDAGSVVVMLGPAPLTLAGEVVTAGGEPAVGCHVVVRDPTVIDPNRSPPETSEDLLGSTGTHVRTDDGGMFFLDGLEDREYSLFCWDESLALAYAVPFQAGSSGLRIVLASDSGRRKISGTLRSRGGVPLGGQSVSVAIVWARDPARLTAMYGFVRGPHARTNADGGFEIVDVPPCDVRISCFGDRIAADLWKGVWLPLNMDEDWVGIDWSVTAACDVELVNSSVAEAVVQVFDAQGEPVAMTYMGASGLRSSKFIRLKKDESIFVSVPEHAVSVAVFDGPDVLDRTPLSLSLDRTTRVDL